MFIDRVLDLSPGGVVVDSLVARCCEMRGRWANLHLEACVLRLTLARHVGDSR